MRNIMHQSLSNFLYFLQNAPNVLCKNINATKSTNTTKNVYKELESYVFKSDYQPVNITEVQKNLSFNRILDNYKGVSALNIDWVNDLSAARNAVITAITKLAAEFANINKKITRPIKKKLTAVVIQPFVICITNVDRTFGPSVEQQIISSNNYTQVNNYLINAHCKLKFQKS